VSVLRYRDMQHVVRCDSLQAWCKQQREQMHTHSHKASSKENKHTLTAKKPIAGCRHKEMPSLVVARGVHVLLVAGLIAVLAAGIADALPVSGLIVENSGDIYVGGNWPCGILKLARDACGSGGCDGKLRCAGWVNNFLGSGAPKCYNIGVKFTGHTDHGDMDDYVESLAGGFCKPGDCGWDGNCGWFSGGPFNIGGGGWSMRDSWWVRPSGSRRNDRDGGWLNAEIIVSDVSNGALSCGARCG
jgi:hypothetical protein